MANLRSWACVLAVVLAISHCTESRTTRPGGSDDADQDYSVFSDEDPGSTGITPEDQMQRDMHEDGVQADGDGDDDDDDEPVGAQQTVLSAPMHAVAELGETVRLPCDISDSNDQSTEVVSWSHGDTLLIMGSKTFTSNPTHNKKIIVHKNWTLVLPSVSAEDAGQYTCTLLTSDPQPPRVVHTLRVAADHAPSILKMEPSNRRVTEGHSLKITCVAEGYPKPTLIWSKKSAESEGNTRITADDGVKFVADSIVIDSVTRQHEGKYFCMAENKVGKPAIQSVDIHVVGKPLIKEHKPQVNAAVGETAVLACTVHYEPRSEITWFKDDQELRDSADVSVSHSYPTSKVRIPSVKEKDFGVYKCVARNIFGSHHRYVSLVQDPVVDPIRVGAGRLVWGVSSHTPVEEVLLEYRPLKDDAEWQRVSLPAEETAERHRFAVSFLLDALPSGRYEARSRARNQHGWSADSGSVFFEGANEEPPESIQAAGVGASLASGAIDLKSASTVLATLISCLIVRFI